MNYKLSNIFKNVVALGVFAFSAGLLLTSCDDFIEVRVHRSKPKAHSSSSQKLQSIRVKSHRSH